MLIYLHIPKTGGTSMLEILSWIYGPYSKEFTIDGVWWAGNEALRGSRVYELPECVLGHLSYGDAELSLKVVTDPVYGMDIQKPFPVFQYATMLRHPIDRIISQFYYKRRLAGGGAEPWYKMGFDENTSLWEYVSSGRDKSLFNAQTAQLSGIVLDKTFVPIQIPTQADFAIARQNMDNILVGVLEHFESSLRYFARELGWPSVPKPVQENEIDHPPPQNHDPKAIQMILELNQFDLLLYDMARERLLNVD